MRPRGIARRLNKNVSAKWLWNQCRELTHGTVRLGYALQTNKDGPQEDVEGKVFRDRELLHEERVRTDEDDVSCVKGCAEVVEVILSEVCVFEQA